MSENQQARRRPRRMVPRWRKQDGIRLAVLAWLVTCWFIGASGADIDLDPFLSRAWPSATRFEETDDGRLRALDSEEDVLGLADTATASGYGGPLRVVISMSPGGIVESLAVVEHRETPAFFQQVLGDRLLERLVGKAHDDPIVLGQDVDGVSGATYTALGLTQAVHRAARSVAQEELGLSVPTEYRRVVFGLPEIALIALFAIGVARRRLSGRLSNALRWASLIAGLILLGFVFNRPFLLAHINMVLVGYWPEWQTHLYWYILILGLLSFKATQEWNVYCYDFCPFGAAQEVLGKIGGAKPRPVRWPTVLLWAQRLITLAAISLALLYRNPGLTSYEIFGTAFRLQGSNFQFVLLAIIVLTSLFLYRPWCRYLCPLHKNTTEGLFDNTRRLARMLWLKVRQKAPAT